MALSIFLNKDLKKSHTSDIIKSWLKQQLGKDILVLFSLVCVPDRDVRAVLD